MKKEYTYAAGAIIAVSAYMYLRGKDIIKNPVRDAASGATKGLVDSAGDIAGGVGSGLGFTPGSGGWYDLVGTMAGWGNAVPPGTRPAVTAQPGYTTYGKKLNLDMSKKSMSPIGLPQSQPVVSEIRGHLSPGQGYVLSPEQSEKFLDPYGDIQFESRRKKAVMR